MSDTRLVRSAKAPPGIAEIALNDRVSDDRLGRPVKAPGSSAEMALLLRSREVRLLIPENAPGAILPEMRRPARLRFRMLARPVNAPDASSMGVPDTFRDARFDNPSKAPACIELNELPPRSSVVRYCRPEKAPAAIRSRLGFIVIYSDVSVAQDAPNAPGAI